MKQTAKSYTSVSFLFSMLLFLTFVLCSVFTVLIGSRVYQNIRARNDAAFYTDTALSYITNKVRQSDRASQITISDMEGHKVLVLGSDYDGIRYETWIYTKDGSLMELFSEQGSGLTLSDGLAIMDCRPVTFALTEEAGVPLLRISLEGTEGNPSSDSLLALRSSTKEGGTS